MLTVLEGNQIENTRDRLRAQIDLRIAIAQEQVERIARKALYDIEQELKGTVSSIRRSFGQIRRFERQRHMNGGNSK